MVEVISDVKENSFTFEDPDLDFIKAIKIKGADTVKKCFQCATCSGICNVTPNDNPFPRKQMLLASWGQKKQLLRDPDIWLCHQCSDCTAYCPRGANPGEVINSIRKYVIEYFSFPKIFGKYISDIRYLPIFVAVPGIALAIILMLTGHFKIPEGVIQYQKLFPVSMIEGIFIPITLFASVALGMGVYNYLKQIDLSYNLFKNLFKANFGQSILSLSKDVFLHDKFNKCEVKKNRHSSHLLVFYGFIGLVITTSWATFNYYLLKSHPPYPMLSPFKFFANISAVVIFVGLGLMIINRIINAKDAKTGSFFDWFFIIVLSLTVLTGILSELFRLLGIRKIAYPTFFSHLHFTSMLFLFAPYTKFAHALYRPAALLYLAVKEGRGISDSLLPSLPAILSNPAEVFNFLPNALKNLVNKALSAAAPPNPDPEGLISSS
jgi:quinone-modifying oxidoreductase subunit QmoC